jgi:hypothetical protein
MLRTIITLLSIGIKYTLDVTYYAADILDDNNQEGGNW